MRHKTTLILATALCAASATASIAANNARISKNAGQICIASNGLPNHAMGRFPNRGNPHAVSAQRIRVCVPSNPKKASQPRWIDRGGIGIALNGVMIRPEAADCWDPSSPRGFSRNCASGWRLEPMGPGNKFGLDQNKAHVDRRGLYHYHGMPSGLGAAKQGTLIGYAADGFEIHHAGGRVKSGYRLKPGKRPSGGGNPGGRYDGSFVEDYQYTGGSGTLDACNGGMLNGKYVYFATAEFPYFPRCLYGTQAKAFR
ncbi:YHYH protein [Salaquimonas pukyongi]|uniref:YHYH protein n=1 Tax=Salaquimonas pukyongi TaxID=2712698 RepID=UPI001FCCDD45|nr:YHYH protein [Salaquimonas pukyongi]